MEKKGDRKLTIVPEEAEIVRRIYRQFLEGYTIGEIRENLQKAGIKTPAGKNKWYHSTILSMLKNEKHMGDLLLQKSYTSDFLTKKRKMNRGEYAQYYVENAHEPIVPKEVFLRAQGELMRRELMKQQGTGRRVMHYPLKEKVICGVCGSPFRRRCLADDRMIWRCTHQGESKVFTEKGIEEERLREGILKAIALLPEREEDMKRIQQKQIGEWIDQITGKMESISNRKREFEKAISDYATSGVLDPEKVYPGDGEAREKQADEMIEKIRDEMKQLEEKWNEEMAEKMELAAWEAQLRSLMKIAGAIEEEEKGDREPACYELQVFLRQDG